MSDMVPEVLNAALDSFFTPKKNPESWNTRAMTDCCIAETAARRCSAG